MLDVAKTTNSPLQLNVIRDRDAFACIRDEWNTMLLLAAAATPFLTWEWLDAWIEEYRTSDQELLILTAYQGSRLVAALPLLVSERCFWTGGEVRLIQMLGTGEAEWEEVCSEYGDLITVEANRKHAVLLFADYLQTLGWDELLLPRVLKNSAFVTHLIPVMRRVTVREIPAGSRYRIALPSTPAEYRAKLRSRMKRRIKRAEALDRSMSIHRERVKTTQVLSPTLNELGRLHQKRWQARNIEGVFASPRFIRFHDLVCRRFLAAGWLAMRTAIHEGQTIAVHYNIRFADTEYYYQSGYDIDNYRNNGLGTMGHIHAVGQSILDQLKYYDFMRGPDQSYKQEYNCQLTPMVDIKIFNRTCFGVLLMLHDLGKSLVRRTRLIARRSWLTS